MRLSKPYGDELVAGWNCSWCFQEQQEKSHIEEVLGSEALQGRTSTLTTEESMDLYCSYFSKVRLSLLLYFVLAASVYESVRVETGIIYCTLNNCSAHRLTASALL